MGSNGFGSKSWRSATRLVRGGTRRSAFDETSESIFMTSGYVYESAEEAEAAFNGEKSRFVYSRYANPTVRMFEERLALQDGARFCRGTSSGMAAMFASLASMVEAGDRVVASRALFGSCEYVIAEQLPKFGVETELVDGIDYGQWERALSKPAKAVFLETPSNPTLEVIDIPRVAELAHNAGARLVVDNVFATPVLQRPLDLGADVVMYSATKHIDGQGRSMGGAILSDDVAYIEEMVEPFLKHTGPALSPFNAWTLLKGLETLELRIHRHCQNASAIADAFVDHPGIVRLLYPGHHSHPQHGLVKTQMQAGGTVLAIDLAGGKDAAFRFLNALRTIDISNNLGDAKSLATHPATTTHQRLSYEQRAELGISSGLIRLSVGLEDADDLIEDVDRGLAATK